MRHQRGMQRVGVGAGQMHQAHHSGLTFDEGADRREVVVTDDEIALPVSGL